MISLHFNETINIDYNALLCMSIDSPEYKNYDVQYSIRLPQDLADEINARAERDGVKPSTWIRNSLVKLIQMKDTENAGNIKAAVMYLLSTDKDVQKQIRLLIGESSEKGGRMSKIESTLTEFTAINDQEIILKRKLEGLRIDISDLHNKMCWLGDELRDVTEKRLHLESAFGNSDDSENMHIILSDFQDKERRIRAESERIKKILDEKRNQMVSYKMFISDLSVRKKKLLEKYNNDLRLNRNGGNNIEESAESISGVDNLQKESENQKEKAKEILRKKAEEYQIRKSRRDAVSKRDEKELWGSLAESDEDSYFSRISNTVRESQLQPTYEELRMIRAARLQKIREEEQKISNRKSVKESEDI